MDGIGFFLLSQLVITDYIVRVILIVLAVIAMVEALCGTYKFVQLLTLILTTDTKIAVIERYTKMHTIKLFPSLTSIVLHAIALVAIVYAFVLLMR